MSASLPAEAASPRETLKSIWLDMVIMPCGIDLTEEAASQHEAQCEHCAAQFAEEAADEDVLNLG